MIRFSVLLLLILCASYLSAQNNITNKLGSGGAFKVLQSDNSTQVFTVQESNGFVSSLRSGFTPEGGLAVKMTNKTGSASVKGTIVQGSSSTDNAFMAATANSVWAFGVVYEGGVADGSDCWVVVSGVADVLLEDGQSSTRGQVTMVSSTAGRAFIGADPGSSHDKEIGHCLETKSSGTNVLIRVALHFR